ncbi:MAG TPA: hypothetical protein VIF57_07305 [Polyangia bacterium]|jgi:hypothetical protein
MVARRLGLVLAAALPLAAGCGSRALDPGMDPTTAGTGGQGVGAPTPMPEDELVATLKLNGGPDKLLMVGTNSGVVTSTQAADGPLLQLYEDPETLVEAAAMAGMPVCSVEYQGLTLDPALADATTLTASQAVDGCLKEDLGDMLSRLGGLKTPETVVVIAANAAITVHSTNGGINYFYDADMLRLLHAARKLYVPACLIAPQALALPTYPQGQTPGLSVDEALATCGRT